MGDEGSGDGTGKGGGAGRPATGAARACCCGLLAFVFLAGLTALILYLVYRPSKPRFTVIGAAIYELNATSAQVPTAISTSMQFTVVIRNPNERSSVFYDRLMAYAMYRDQPITPPAPLPPMYQDEDSTVAVSPVLGGAFVPVSAEVAGGLVTDQAYGAVGLRLVVMGRLKYKAGPFRSAWTRIFVRCDLLVGLKKGTYGQVPLLGAAGCSVST